MTIILARTLLFAGVGILPVLAGNQILLRNLDAGDGSPKVLTSGSAGQLFVISELTSAQMQISRVVQLDTNGVRMASVDLQQMRSPSAAVVDPEGNLIVVGADQSYQGLVMKVNPQLLSFATVATLPARVTAVAVDGSGNIFLTGATSSPSFPVTADAYQNKPPLVGPYGAATYSFLTELSPTRKIIYSTYFGSDVTQCLGGSFCVATYGTTTGTAIALDAAGSVVIAGVTTATGLPTTAGVLAPECVCGYNYAYTHDGYKAGFVAKFQPGAAQQLQWSTFINATASPIPFTVNSLALDPAGNVILSGSADQGLPVPSSGIHILRAASSTSGAYVLELSRTGTSVVWGSYLATQDSAVDAVLVDSQGRVLFGGYNGKVTFVGRATSTGATLIEFYPGPQAKFSALTLTPTGGFAAMFPVGALWIETTSAGPSLLDVTDSASGEYANPFAPAELITLYGIGIGPQSPMLGELANGRYTTSLGGYQVLFNNEPLPLLYADSGQINTVIPPGAGGSPRLQVVTPSGTIDGPGAPVTYAHAPGIFQNAQAGLAAAVNQDGHVNSISNPARAGEIVTIFANANSGQFFPVGSLVPMGIYEATTTVWVVDDYRSLEVVWAGAAPGMVNGVMQVNFRLPQNLPPLENTFAFSLIVEGMASGKSLIAVAP